MNNIDIFHIDAFTKEFAKGNPALVCIPDLPVDSKIMQDIAFEINLSEAAFLFPRKTTKEYDIRWFTPLKEVDLCGHATLAAAKVLLDIKNISDDKLIFHSKSGKLIATKDEYGISLDFPLDTYEMMEEERFQELVDALGIKSYVEIFRGINTHKLVIRLDNEKDVKELQPNYEKMLGLSDLDIKGVAVTADSKSEYDCITRYFNPWVGVNEDPVTGSVHTVLADYWSEELEKQELRCYQSSKRGGEIILRVEDNGRVKLIGDARLIYSGFMQLD